MCLDVIFLFVQVEYCEWTTTDRAELKTIREEPDEFVEKLFSSLEKLKGHSFIAENQHKVSTKNSFSI